LFTDVLAATREASGLRILGQDSHKPWLQVQTAPQPFLLLLKSINLKDSERDHEVTFTETQAGAPLGFPSPLIIAWLDFGKNSPLKHLLVRIVNCAQGELKEGDEVKLVVYEVPVHPMEVKKETKICDRVYYAFEPVE